MEAIKKYLTSVCKDVHKNKRAQEVIVKNGNKSTKLLVHWDGNKVRIDTIYSNGNLKVNIK